MNGNIRIESLILIQGATSSARTDRANSAYRTWSTIDAHNGMGGSVTATTRANQQAGGSSDQS